MIATLLATDVEIVQAASDGERGRAREILQAILPVSARARGLLNDGLQAGDPPQQALERITVPTLAISCEDDRFRTHQAARHIADTARGARLLSYRTGGHIWIGNDTEVFTAIDDFLRAS
jgi:pimeloyl-ACP methyl ester carboxylesterase